MRIATSTKGLVLVGLVLCALLAIQSLPAHAQDSEIVMRFKKLNASITWQLVDETIQMQFNTYHPQGMYIIDEYIFFSAVEIIEKTEKGDNIPGGYDRTPGKGNAYLFKTDRQGNLIAQVKLGSGDIYHPGGIDYDGKHIWVPVAEYRPHSRSIIYRVDPSSMEATEVFRYKDHISGLAVNTADETLHGISWGSRIFYTWGLNDLQQPTATDPDLKESQAVPKSRKPNGSHYIDYQDCHYLQYSYMLCGGLNKYKNLPNLGEYALGGLDLVELRSQQAVHQIAVPQWVKPDLVMTNNPFFFELMDDHLRFYFMPEDSTSKVYIFDVR